MWFVGAIGQAPVQAKWIVKRLIADRRISAEDVRSLLSDLGNEIVDIERRLAILRGMSARPAPVTSLAPRTEVRSTKNRKSTGHGKKGHVCGIAGTHAVLLRSIPAAEHAAIAAIRADKCIKAAIKAAQAAMKK